jgi:hypothetical protein
LHVGGHSLFFLTQVAIMPYPRRLLRLLRVSGILALYYER